MKDLDTIIHAKSKNTCAIASFTPDPEITQEQVIMEMRKHLKWGNLHRNQGFQTERTKQVKDRLRAKLQLKQKNEVSK